MAHSMFLHERQGVILILVETRFVILMETRCFILSLVAASWLAG